MAKRISLPKELSQDPEGKLHEKTIPTVPEIELLAA
jgi:hypothetical protein